MSKDYSNRNLQKALFKSENLGDANFTGSDLRGADFCGSDLTGANFTLAKTGLTTVNTILIFIASLAFSLLAGYVAMLAGQTVQEMLASKDQKIKIAGIIAVIITILFIIYYYRSGGGKVLIYLILPVFAFALVIAIVAYISGLGTGMGMLYLVLSLILVLAMFLIGTIARVTAGSLSNVLFVIVAASGTTFGRSLGGGIGTVIMAVACALISRRALTGAKGFERLRKVALFITSRFGTSFRNTNLYNANFSGAKIQNADFTNADISLVDWGDSRKMNCIINEN